MIELKKISKSYGEIPVINKISLFIPKGQVVAIIGPSGSGKSTLLRCINFLEEPDSGEIFFNETKISSDNILEIRKKIGMVFQNFNLFPHMSVIENIIYAPINVLGKTKNEAIKNAKELLKKVGLSNKANHFPSSLSGGQKQRVAIARSLAMNPEVILFDEPTSALDPEMTSEVLEVIKNFVSEGLTILMVTHEINFAKELADRIIFIDHGEIIEDEKPEIFFKNPKTKRAKQFLEKIL